MVAETAADEAPLAEGLGLLGSGILSAFLRLAEDAQHAPAMADKVMLARMAADELGALDVVERAARARGIEPQAAMEPFRGALVDFDARTQPSDWAERLVKTYVGYGVIEGFQRQVWSALPGDVRENLRAALGDGRYAAYVVGALTPVLERDPQLAARLALWGRRVSGEALGAVQHLLYRHPLLVPVRASDVLGAVSGGHAARMERLGLRP